MNKRKVGRKVVLFLLSMLLICSFTACKKVKELKQQENLTFDEYMDSLLKEDLASDLSSYVQFVENPKDYGITSYSHTILGPGKANFDAITKQCEERLAKLLTYDYESLTNEQKITYDTLKTYYENRIAIKDCCYYQEPLSTIDGDHIILPGSIALHTSRFFETLKNRGIQEASAIEEYFYVYEAVDQYLKEVAQFEREKADAGLFMSSEEADDVIDLCESIIDNKAYDFKLTFEDEIKKLSWLGEDERNALLAKNTELAEKHVVSGYQAIVDAMKECAPKGGKSKGLYETELGKKYYEYVLKAGNNDSATPLETAALLEQYVTSWNAEVDAIVQSNPTIMKSVNDKLSAYEDVDTLIQTINEGAKADFPDLNLTWGVKDMPTAMNGFAMGLFYPQPLDSTSTEHSIYAGTMLTPGTSAYVQTIGHEGVPGHLYNYCYFLNLDITPYRKLIGWVNSLGTLEGWTTYIEEYAYRYIGLTEQEARYLELQRLLELGLVQRVDIGVNYEGWQEGEVANYLSKNGPMYAMMSAYIKWLVQNSINMYGPYGVGYINLIQIKDQMKQNMGENFTDLQFHEAYLNIGPTTFDILRKQLLSK